MKKVKNDMILSLDLIDILKSYELCEAIYDYIDTIKIGYPLTLSEGLKSIGILKENFDFTVICDYKLADIPATNEKIAKLSYEKGADYLIVHGFLGSDSVKACLDVASQHNKDIFLLSEMSHPGSSMFLKSASENIIRMGLDLGIKNYVAPSNKIERLSGIRRLVGDDSFIISPGVGTQGGDPKETLKYADALIVGRSIYEASDPETAIINIIKSL
ncbi:MAG: orotidine-5'-phosphate decarboxylase [Methanobrevibacter sp.]|jgi:orotidine-5'-phosphate decarboxylase|nr:orotidine-5'-phosphate decarboxylase [Candidatus Methanovirga basalitermitum]